MARRKKEEPSPLKCYFRALDGKPACSFMTFWIGECIRDGNVRLDIVKFTNRRGEEEVALVVGEGNKDVDQEKCAAWLREFHV